MTTIVFEILVCLTQRKFGASKFSWSAILQNKLLCCVLDVEFRITQKCCLTCSPLMYFIVATYSSTLQAIWKTKDHLSFYTTRKLYTVRKGP